MRALRNAAAALAFSSLLILAGHADADNRPESRAETSPVYEATKGEALDAYIAGRLITAYGLSEHLNPFWIGVTVKDAKVVLTGTVETEVQRDLALEIARGIEQARAVYSKITVDPQLRRQESAGQREGPQQKFSRTFSDAGITARVKTRLLWNGSTNGLAVDVATDYRTVTLSGTVNSAAESALAELIAQNTQGVARVENFLKVAPESSALLRARSMEWE